jgi:hypothetical protein
MVIRAGTDELLILTNDRDKVQGSTIFVARALAKRRGEKAPPLIVLCPICLASPASLSQRIKDQACFLSV